MIQFSFSSKPTDKTEVKEIAKNILHAKDVKNFRIIKKSIDARKKDDVRIVWQVALETENDSKYIRKDVSEFVEKENTICSLLPDNITVPKLRPIVVGSGPAGLFAGLTLAYADERPIIIERGKAVEEREKDISSFFITGNLNYNSNVQFGEGGAGTFSDGKLNTNLHNGFIPIVLNEFVKAGAPEEILYLAKPHIGTDNLRNVVINIRNKIISLGGDFLYNTTLTDIGITNGKVSKIITDKGEIECEKVFLAIGHSARDTFEMLLSKNIKMESKIFSIGVRIEHLRENINNSQYGRFAKFLPSADYKMAVVTKGGESLYTFCMCPGGRVINASSEENGVCVNGMSYYARNDTNSNSAILVNVTPKDFGSEHPFSGVLYQRKYERLAYNQSNKYQPIVQRLGDLKNGRITDKFGSITPSVESKYTLGDLRLCLPKNIIDAIIDGTTMFGHKIKGFDDDDSILTGVETRSSSPIRILRDDNFCSSVSGLYPIGEGAGYAGGITSSAIDGLRVTLKNL